MVMAVQELFQKVLGDGARASKFDLIFQLAGQNSDSINRSIPMLVKATQFPAKGHKKIDLMYKGRIIPVRGQVAYTNDWRCTFYLTEDHALKRAFENWIEALDETIHFDEHLDAGVDENINHFANYDYKVDIELYQASFSEDAKTSKYVLHNVFPVEVSPIEVAYDNISQISTFDVTFAYTHFSEAVSTVKNSGINNNPSYGLGGNTTYASEGSNMTSFGSITPVNGLLNRAGVATSMNSAYQFAGQLSQQASRLVNATKNTFDDVFSFSSNANGTASSNNASFINSSILKNGVNAIKNTVGTVNSQISDFTKSAQIISGEVRQEFSSMLQPLGQIVSGIKNYTNGVNAIKNQIQGTINSAKNQVTSVKNQIQSITKI